MTKNPMLSYLKQANEDPRKNTKIKITQPPTLLLNN